MRTKLIAISIINMKVTYLYVKMNEMSSTDCIALGETVDTRQVGFRHLGKLGEVNISGAGVQNLVNKKKEKRNSITFLVTRDTLSQVVHSRLLI